MSALELQQQQLLQALWQPRQAEATRQLATSGLWASAAGPEGLERGLLAYRANGRVLAERALRAAYPAVAGILGEEDFAGLARQLWLRHPPLRGDVAQWGGELAAHLETLTELLEDAPALPDVARIEWALHCAATARDGDPDPASFQLLTQDPDATALRLAPGLCCIASAWPAVSIVLAHAEGSERQAAAAETAVVWRHGLRPRVRTALQGEAALLQALQQGQALAQALASAPAVDLQAWLPMAVQTGLVLGARPA